MGRKGFVPVYTSRPQLLYHRRKDVNIWTQTNRKWSKSHGATMIPGSLSALLLAHVQSDFLDNTGPSLPSDGTTHWTFHLAEKVLAFLSRHYAGISCSSFGSPPLLIGNGAAFVKRLPILLLLLFICSRLFVCVNKSLKGNESRNRAARRENGTGKR